MGYCGLCRQSGQAVRFGKPFNGCWVHFERFNPGTRDMRHTRRWSVLAFVFSLLAGSVLAYAAEDVHECDNGDSERRIRACTELIETPGVGIARLATAYASRALAYSLRGEYQTSIRDYDKAIGLIPEYAVALNNRAWAYFKGGRAAQGMPDVERSLQLDPLSSHSLDTRAHINQTMGNGERAMRDYESAMVYGGQRMVTLYQCGLKMHRLYSGPNDGVIRAELISAMKACVALGAACDPLPPDEECREAVS